MRRAIVGRPVLNKAGALHEAAHTVIARSFGFGVTYATIRITGPGILGSMHWYFEKERRLGWEQHIDLLIKDAMLSLAGPLAEEHESCPASELQGLGSRSDVEDAITCVRRIASLIRKKTGGNIDAATLLDELRQGAVFLVNANWFAIERVAQGLLERWMLDQDSVDALIKAAWLDQGQFVGPGPRQGECRRVVEKANAMNTISLEAAVQQAKKATPDAEAPAQVSTMTFKLHQIVEAALEKAKEKYNTTFDSVGLEATSQHYVSPAISFTNWEQALEHTYKHFGRNAFACELVIKLEKMFPWMIIDRMEISIKPT